MSDPLAVLQRIRTPRPPAPRMEVGEQCELCTEPIAEEHGHLVDLEGRSLLCACRGCYLLFTSEGAGGGHYRAVPDRYVAFPDFQLSPAQWESLQIPVSVAFFKKSRRVVWPGARLRSDMVAASFVIYMRLKRSTRPS